MAIIHKIRIGITTGDPLGIGPEITEKALQGLEGQEFAFKVFGRVGLKSFQHNLSPYDAGSESKNLLQQAITAFQNSEIDALVTSPICKAHISLAGFDFPGHTEFLADQSASSNYLMMLASPDLKVTLVTIHEGLAQVPKLLTQEKILHTIKMTHFSLSHDFAIPEPKIGVLALNPHAGEAGKFGREEIELIRPAIEEALKVGIDCEGPLVPDAIWPPERRRKYDALVCMYHDQGLIPFKMLHFHDGVNFTAGLPWVRTSPDHGTAFDIAGQGIADASSMIAAVKMAAEIVKNRASLRV